MARKRHCIHLTVEERRELGALIAAGRAAVSKRHRAQVLPCADENHGQGAMKDRDIARAVGVSVPSVERTRCALAGHGLQVAVHGWPSHRKEPREITAAFAGAGALVLLLGAGLSTLWFRRVL